MPFQYVKRTVTVVATSKTVSVACGGKRIAIHERAFRKGDYRTNPEHMPDAHRDYVEWDGNRFRRWAAEIGESTKRVIDAILASRKVEQQSYRSCRGVLALQGAWEGASGGGLRQGAAADAASQLQDREGHHRRACQGA